MYKSTRDDPARVQGGARWPQEWVTNSGDVAACAGVKVLSSPAEARKIPKESNIIFGTRLACQQSTNTMKFYLVANFSIHSLLRNSSWSKTKLNSYDA